MSDDDDGREERERLFKAYDTRRTAGGPKLGVVGGTDAARGPFQLHPARLPDPCSIPPREWLYGTQLIRGYVSVLVSPGGSGKSSYAIAAGLDLITGKGFLDEHVFRPLRVAIVNLDDPLEELERRVAAVQIRYKIKRAELDGKLFLDSGEARGLTVAELDKDGHTVAYPDVEALISQIQQHGIDVIIVDPFAESHSLEENNNPQMVKAAAAWRRVARSTNCAVWLIHHVRKGDLTSIDAARGAKAVTDSARVGLLLSTMSDEDALLFEIDEDERHSYIRLDDAKRNMAAARSARWFRLEPVQLGNGDINPLYPNGDSVQVVVPWKPEGVWQRTTPEELHAVLHKIEAGPEPGVRYSPTKQGGSARWVGQVLMKLLDVTEPQAKLMVQAWLKSGLLIERKYFDHRRQVSRELAGVFVRETEWPTV